MTGRKLSKLGLLGKIVIINFDSKLREIEARMRKQVAKSRKLLVFLCNDDDIFLTNPEYLFKKLDKYVCM